MTGTPLHHYSVFPPGSESKPEAAQWHLTLWENGAMTFAETEASRSFGAAARMLQMRRRDIFLVQIGAMDGVSFDPVHAFIREFRWRALLIEPLPDLFRELVRNYAGVDGVMFENCAIAGHCGTSSMYRVPIDLIRSGEVPVWASGISSVFPDRNAIGGRKTLATDYALIKDSIVVVSVAAMTLDAVFKKHQIGRVDVLQIDTEGSDLIVLKQFDFDRYRPAIIHIEHYNLPLQDQRELFHLLLDKDYNVSIDQKDALAVDLH